MKIVIANTDSMVEKLIEACAKKTGLKVQHFISLEEIDVSMLEDCFLFVDENALGGDTKRAKQIGSGSLSCLIYSRRKPLDEFKYLVQKPFLPTQVLEILRKELVRRGEDISRVVEEDSDKKAPIEPIKDIPLNEFDLKDEHLFEGNLELPPLPDTDAVETKTSAQSAKEQKEQDELQNDEENFLDVGENIAHKSLAALERGQSEQSGVSDEIIADMPSDDFSGDDSSAPSLTESLVGELTEVNALGVDSSDSSEMGGLSSDLDGDFGLDSARDMTSQAPDSAGDIRDSLAGGLDSLDNLGSLDNIDSIDNVASADLESTDNLNPVNSMKGNLAGLGALENSLDDTLDSSLDSALDSALDSSLDSAEVAQGTNMDSADLGGLESSLESNVNSNVDSNLDSAEGVDLATQIESSEISKASEVSEKDELLGGDSLEDLSSLGADLKEDLPNLDESIADSADIAQEMQESSLQETNEQETSGQEINKTQASDLQETQEAQDLQSSPDFAANGGVLDKDEAKTIQELLNGNSQDKQNEVAEANKTAINQATQTSDIAESTNEKAQEATQETPQQEVAQEDSAQEVAKQSSEVSEEKTAEDIDDFAELNENDIMEVLGEDTPNENAENTLDKQATTQQESQESQEVAKESSTQDAQELAQESSPEPSVDNVADLGGNVAESVKSTSAISKTTQDAEVAQDDTTTQAENIAQIAQTEEMAESTPQKDEKSADEVASALESADNIGGIDENAEVGDIDGEVLKDLQDNLAQDLEKGLADELPTALQNDLVEGMPPSQDTKQDSAQDDNTEQEDSAERVSRQLKELDSSLEQDLASDIGESSEIMTEDLTNDTESNDLESSGLTGGDLGDEVAKENAELPKSLEELESLVDSSDGDLGELNKLDSIIEGDSSGEGDSSDEGDFSGEDLSADLADSSMQTNADSSLDFIPESGISQYLNIDETSTQESLPKKEQNSAIKSTQKRLITELLANKSAEEISSLLEGAHIHIDIDFSQK